MKQKNTQIEQLEADVALAKSTMQKVYATELPLVYLACWLASMLI